jgi:hypothetical protein
MILLLLTAPACLSAQQPDQPPGPPPPPVIEPANAPAPPAGPLFTVHGVVLNAVSNEPLPHALVRIEGDAETGALTDGEGRFEIPQVPSGPQSFQIVKPGFSDNSGLDQMAGSHNVLVAAAMPELRFRLVPTAVLYGQIALSSGDPGIGLHLHLLRQNIADGRARWQMASRGTTGSDGNFRFSGLSAGDYLLYTEPALESQEISPLIQSGHGAAVERFGFPSVFYPQARSMAGAEKIHLGSGDRVQANLTLTLEPFHTVTALVTLPHGRTPTPEEANLRPQVLDLSGQPLLYNADFNAATRTVQASLPDGDYTLLLSSAQNFARQQLMRRNHPGDGVQPPEFLSGAVNFTLAGHPLEGLVLPLSAPPANTAQLTLLRSPDHAGAARTEPSGPINIVGAQIGSPLGNGMTIPFAFNLKPGQNPAAIPPPGEYWLRVYTMDPVFCVQSLTAGGMDLAHEPLHVGLNGAIPPMELVLRDDCAKLTLSLPPALNQLAAGEEQAYTVYVVPAIDSPVSLLPITLRATSGGSVPLSGLTPGPYRVFTFDRSVELEVHNPDALAALPHPGQAVTLQPNGAVDLVVEVPQP